MIMEIKAITEALKYLHSNQHERAVIVTDFMCTLKKIMNCFMYADWMTTISEGTLERIVWIFTPGHAGVIGNERADTLADAAVFDNNLTLDAPTVIQIVTEKLLEKKPHPPPPTHSNSSNRKELAPETALEMTAGDPREKYRTTSLWALFLYKQ